MREYVRAGVCQAIEAFDVARDAALIVAAAENTVEGDDALQTVLDALALATARAMAMLPPVSDISDEWC